MTSRPRARQADGLLRVALTGGIATGKSYVLAQLGRRGVPTIDADRVARDVVRPGRPAWAALVERFGADICRPDRQVDRARLGGIVFADAVARADLEAIVHPPVRQAIADWFEAREAEAREAEARAALAVADIPLLYETRREGSFDRVVVTACPSEMQERRIVARDGLPVAEARRRIEAQLPIEHKTARADFVIRTDGTLEETDRQVDAVLEALRRGAPGAEPWIRQGAS